jgi:serine/threonine-protein kinase
MVDTPSPHFFGRYRIQHLLGVGASGPVLRGLDPDTGASVAIKLLDTRLPPEDNQQVVDDLTMVVNQLPPHPAFATLRAASFEKEQPYVVSDLADGEPLNRALERFGPGAIEDVLPRLQSIADGLDHAARFGVCHGALHPRDVMVSRASTLVTGIGIADILDSAGCRLHVRPPYTAPELPCPRIRASKRPRCRGWTAARFPTRSPRR